MIGIVVPAHNEEDHLARCLEALAAAARHPGLGGEPVTIMVVLDACTDGSAAIAARYGASDCTTCTVSHRNVGAARSAGAARLLVQGARWLAFTDADSVVAPDWLTNQLGLNADAVCGLISIDDWSEHPPAVASRFLKRYEHRDDHRHVHGANLGVCARAYQLAGGFGPDRVSEDVALVQRLLATGARVAWSALPRVVTSARREARASGGFADYLLALALPAVSGEAGRPFVTDDGDMGSDSALPVPGV